MKARGLQHYRGKRDFAATPEPRGREGDVGGAYRYVIQKHAARRLHYDFRLEFDGSLKSWAVTRGPSLVAGEKRLAIRVEDHPIEYVDFEGTIPQGQYGGGTVMIWDRGIWHPEGNPRTGYRSGHLNFSLDGGKLRGRWHLMRMRRKDKEKEAWLLIKGQDEAARLPNDEDVLEEMPLSIATGRSLDEIAVGRRKGVRAAAATRAATKDVTRKASTRAHAAPPRKADAEARGVRGRGNVRLTHPDRTYWVDVGVTKQDLADYYGAVWKFAAPQIVGRPLALVRCPEGTAGQCFFQKHAAAGLAEARLRSVIDKNNRQIIAVEDLDGVLSLVQAGTLEIHVRGSTIDQLDLCDRIVFDLDPGENVEWPAVVAAAQAVRERLDALKLESFVKLSGGKGLHVVLPVKGTNWASAKAFAQDVASELAADEPARFVAKMAKSLRTGKVFVDYLRNSLEQTSIAAYSTRARPRAPIAIPVSWEELGGTTGASQFTVQNVTNRLRALKRDPWRDMARVRQQLPEPTGRKGGKKSA